MQHDFIYQAIMQRIQERAQRIKYIDLYNGQLDADDPEALTFPLPAALIEFVPGEVISSGNRVQRQTLEVLIYVVSEQPQEANSLEADSVRRAALEHAPTMREVSAAICGLNSGNQAPVGFSSMARVGIDTFNLSGMITANIITFRTYVDDRTMISETEDPEADVVIQV